MDILKEFGRKTILVVGDIILDRFIYGDVSRISPEAPVPVVKVQHEEFKAGGAANVAANLISLKVKAVLCGGVGDDYYGNFAIERFRKSGMDTSAVVQIKSHTTTIKTRIIARKQQVVRIDRETKVKDNTGNLITVLVKNIKKADAVIIADYGKGVITKELLDYLIPAANKLKKIITVDPQTEHFFRYKNVTTITPNHLEASSAAGMPVETDAEAKRAGLCLLKKLNLKSIVITRGEKGMTVIEKGKILNIPTRAKDVFDVTGAGDTVIAVLTAALSAGCDIFESARIANAAAGIVVGKFGTASVSQKELRECM
ncbi:MAG: D-glycero-beta-D-manno-heptose-7-phosphate kinase [bacterium]